MGSVSSIVNGHSLNNKHCQTPDCKLKKGTGHQRKTGGRTLDGLLKYGFTQGSSSSTQPSKGLSHSRSGRSEDFFYIKVSNKPRCVYPRGAPMEDNGGGGTNIVVPKLLPVSGKQTERANADKSRLHSTAFKPVVPQNASTAGHANLDHFLSPPEKPRSQETYGHKQDTFSGTLSDSGRNSMSSLPTHSTSGSLSASTGPVTQSVGSLTPAYGLTQGLQPNFLPWSNGNGVNPCSGYIAAVSDGGLSPKANGYAANQPSPLCETGGGIRSPITTDEVLIERLEQSLLERESELHELQEGFEEKEADTCQLFEERQRYCAEEMEGLKQRCSTKLRQVSQRVARTQHALQQQVNQLQAEKEKLQENIAKLAQEKDLADMRLRSYETMNTHLAPTLEETQWEVCQKTGEISLLKQQLRDGQADISHKLNEIVSLKASLKDSKAKIEALEKQNKEHEEKIYSRMVEVEVCQNELQRKKNEADLLREKVGKLEADIQGMKKDLAKAKEHRHEQSLQLQAQVEARALDHLKQGTASPTHTQGEGNRGHASTDFLQREVERLKEQLSEEKEARDKLTSSFVQERLTWNKEKERVIKYQKQLQISYLQMHKKNQDLERILKELTAELESRTELDMDVPYSSGLQTYDDVIATEI